MRDLLKELQSRFMTDKGKLDTLASIATEELLALNHRISKIEASLELFQNAIYQTNQNIAMLSLKLESLNDKPKRKKSEVKDAEK